MELYENFNESNYDVFVNKAKEIFSKYQKKCSKINKNLVLFNSSCTFPEKNLHGGNPCGDDGEWDTSTCIPSYCDNNYIFDKKNQQCLFDNCTIIESNSFSYFFIIVFILSILITIHMIISSCYICYRNSKKKNNLSDLNQKIINEEEEENIN